MTSRPFAPRWAFWLVAAALLLKAALPLLAAASAHAQGRALVEVCTVYGVATVELGDAGAAPQPDAPVVPHTGEHCALGAVVALAPHVPAAVTTAFVSAPAIAAPMVPATATPERPDRGAAWVARLLHAPPFRA